MKTKTKIIKLSKSVYDGLIFIKEANEYHSMSETINNITKCGMIFLSGIDKDSKGVFYIGYGAGKRQMRPTKATTHQARINADVYTKIFNAKVHPDETLNNVVFRSICRHYDERYLYRIFEDDNEDCKELNKITDELMQNEIYKEKFLIEKLPANHFTEFLHKYEIDGALTFPVVLFYSKRGKLWNQITGRQTENEVKEFFNQYLTKKEKEKL
jgi:hypothetical protein